MEKDKTDALLAKVRVYDPVTGEDIEPSDSK